MRMVWRWLPVVAWSAVILIGSSDELSPQHTGSWMHSLFGFEVPHAIHVLIRKAGHVLVYGILGALAYRASLSGAPPPPAALGEMRRRGRRRPTEYVVPLLIALLVASLDETRQSFTRLRTGSPFDVLLDVAGAAAAIWLIRSRMSRHA